MANNENELGPLVSRHPAARRPSGQASLVVLLLGFTLLFALGQIIGEASASPIGWFLAIGSAFGGVLLVRHEWRRLRTSIEVHAEGLVVRRGNVLRYCKWSEVETIRYAGVRTTVFFIPVGMEDSTTLTFGDESTLTVDDSFRNFDEFASSAREQTLPFLLGRALLDLRRGGEVAFGKLRLSTQGIHEGERFLRWQDCLGMTPYQGIVEIYTHNPKRPGKSKQWSAVSVAEIDNFAVLLAIVSQFTKAIAP